MLGSDFSQGELIESLSVPPSGWYDPLRRDLLVNSYYIWPPDGL